MIHGESGWLLSFPAGALTQQRSTSSPSVPRAARLSLPQTYQCTAPEGTIRCFGRSPSRTVVSFPLLSWGSAPALAFSRPAQRSLAFRPVCSLSRPKGGPLTSVCLSLHRYLRGALWLLPTEATRVGWSLNPLGQLPSTAHWVLRAR